MDPNTTDIIQSVFRWTHIVAGITWIGLLYFFNFVNSGFAPTLDAESKKKVVPELMPRALYWFRWGAAWTWITGVLLVALVFYHGKLFLEDPTTGWTPQVIAIVAFTFLGFIVYDVLIKTLGKANYKAFVVVGFLIIGGFVYLAQKWAGFSYRGFEIHVGGLFGTIMAANVWMRIWPAQRRIITAVKAGTAPDPVDVATAGLRSRNNTYLSVPLVWTMINVHTTWANRDHSWAILMGVIAVGWLVVYLLYKKAGKVKGF